MVVRTRSDATRFCKRYSPAQVANPDLRWESVSQFNVGMELRAFDWLTVNGTFNRVTNDEDASPLPDYIGNDAPMANLVLC